LVELLVDPIFELLDPLIASALLFIVLLEVVFPVAAPLPDAFKLELLEEAPAKVLLALPFSTLVAEFMLLLEPDIKLTVPVPLEVPVALEFEAPTASVLLLPLCDRFAIFI
jgi:hypothetical protein